MKQTRMATRLFTWLAMPLTMGAGILFAPKPSSSKSLPQQSDNTIMNKGDANSDASTADRQKMNAGDRAITQKIRAKIMEDESLSTYAHNVKTIAQDGKVTLKSPVRSADEKAAIEEKASSIAGTGNVTSQIEIVPPKS